MDITLHSTNLFSGCNNSLLESRNGSVAQDSRKPPVLNALNGAGLNSIENRELKAGYAAYHSEKLTIRYTNKDGDSITLSYDYEQAKIAQASSSEDGDQSATDVEKLYKYNLHLQSSDKDESFDKSFVVNNNEDSEELSEAEAKDEDQAGVSMFSDEWKNENDWRHISDMLTYLASYTDMGEGFLDDVFNFLNRESNLAAAGAGVNELSMQHTGKSGESISIHFEDTGVGVFAADSSKTAGSNSSPADAALQKLAVIKDAYLHYRQEQMDAYAQATAARNFDAKTDSESKADDSTENSAPYDENKQTDIKNQVANFMNHYAEEAKSRGDKKINYDDLIVNFFQNFRPGN